MFDFSLTVPAWMARLVLMINPYQRHVLVMCRGYSEDDRNLTELVWEDDRNLDFGDKESYPEFQLWVRMDLFGLVR